MAVGFSNTNKPINPRGNDASPKGYNRAELFSGKALDFDGVNDVVNCGDVSALDFGTGNFSVSLYVKINSAQSSLKNIFSKKDAAAATAGYSIFYNHSTGKLLFSNANGTSASEIFSADSFTQYEDQWIHLVAVRDSSDDKNAYFYINAVKHELASTLTIYDTDNSYDFKIGNTHTGAYFNNQQVAGLKAFNTALTAAQVADLYNNPEKIVPTGVADSALKLWLPMQEGAGTTAYDGSGNGNHGTISGATYTHGIGAPVAQTAVIDWNKGTNIIPNIEVYGGAQVSNTTGLANDPAGRNYAVRLTKDDATTPRYVQQSIGTTLDGNSTYVLSSFFKYDGHAFTSSLEYNNNSHWGGTSWICPVIVSSSGVTLGTPSNCTSNVVAYSNDWYRVDVTIVTGGSPGFTADYLIKMQGGSGTSLLVAYSQVEKASSVGAFVPTFGTAQTSDVLLPQGLTTGRDLLGNLFENVRKQGALNLDGNSWAEVHDNESLDIGDFSLEMWVKFEKNGNYQVFFAKDDSSSDRSYELGLDVSETNFFANIFGTGSGYTTSIIENNVWYHLVSTFDISANDTNHYINGVLNRNFTLTETQNNTDAPLIIGAWYTKTHFFTNGQIAQPRIYNRALTAAEVLQNYNSGKNTYK